MSATNVRGAQVTTSFAAVILDSISGPIDVQSQNGSVEVSSTASRDNCQPLSIRTSFGAIRLRIPPDAGYHVAARTSFGKIRSDFPLTVMGSMSTDELNGTIGNGRCEMTLTDQNAAIEILKQ